MNSAFGFAGPRAMDRWILVPEQLQRLTTAFEEFRHSWRGSYRDVVVGQNSYLPMSKKQKRPCPTFEIASIILGKLALMASILLLLRIINASFLPSKFC